MKNGPARFATRLALASGAWLILSLSANAQPALEHSTAPILNAAAETAAAHAADQYAFTVDHWGQEGDKETTVKLRYDPRLPKGEQWRVLEPDAEHLDKGVKKVLKQLQKAESDENPLLYEKLDEMLAVAEFVEETDTEAVFVAQVDEDDLPKDALEVFMTLNKQGGYVSRIDVKSKKSFKPLPIAKVTNLVQSQFFAAPIDGGPALLAHTEGVVEGEAMFKSFKSVSRQTFSDIEKVETAKGE